MYKLYLKILKYEWPPHFVYNDKHSVRYVVAHFTIFPEWFDDTYSELFVANPLMNLVDSHKFCFLILLTKI